MGWAYEQRSGGEAARVLLVTQRRARHGLAQALQFELEDVVRDLEGADLLAPVRDAAPPILLRRASSLAERIVAGSSALFTRDRPRIGRRYELLVVVVGSLADLQYLWPMGGLLRCARAAVCVVDEVWREGLAARRGELRWLARFDHVFSGTAGAVGLLEELTSRPCSYLPPTVDAVALCPFPEQPARVIDVYAMGRKSAATHRALRAVAATRGWFYLYDTLAQCSMPDFQEHRRHLRDVLQRTRFLLAYPGKIDVPQQTGGQEEIGYRYFEGAAAGTVLVGQAPATPWFERLFGWADAIVPLPYDTSDPEAVRAALELSPAREQAIRRVNVVESLRRHDHLHRWAEVLRTLGLPETPRMDVRRRRLEELADGVSRGAGAEGPSERPAGRA